MTISEIEIIPIKPRNGLIAFASVIIDNQFYVSNIALHTSPSALLGYRLVYPDKILANGKRVHCFHPISKEAGNAIQQAIIRKYEQILNKI